jgi:phosphatidylglycerol lysyltransferase
MMKRLSRFGGPMFGLGLLAVMLWVLYGQLAMHPWQDICRQVQALPWWRLALALALTLLAYAVMPVYDLLGLRYLGRKVPTGRAVLISLLSYAFSNNVGFLGLSGGAVRLRHYPAYGLTTGEVVKLVAFTAGTFWLGLLTVSGVMFVVQPLSLPESPYLPLTSVRPLGAAFLAVAAAYVVLSAVRRRPVRLWKWEVALPCPRVALGQLAIGAVDWALAAAPLYVLLAAWNDVSLPAFLAMFLLAQVVAVVSHVPGGLGVFEAVMVLLLRPSVPPDVALGALLVYRVVYYLLPLAIGVAAMGGYELAQRRQAVRPFGRVYRRWAGLVVPDLLAALTFLGGVVLLLSGATPGAQHRLGWLGMLVPLPVIEVSHFVGSLAGLGLLLLAAGLRKRFDAAYWLAAGLLAVGIAASLLKGLDFEEAGILAVFLAALLPCRREFHRPAALFSGRFTPTWVSGVCLVLLAVLWLTLFAHNHQKYSREVWWQFELSASAPRSLRAAVGVCVLGLILAGRELLRPVPHRHRSPAAADLDRAGALAECSPATTAYLALLGDKSLLFDGQHSAFVMYAVSGRSLVAMGDPVGPAGTVAGMAREFHKHCDRAGGQAVFYQVTPANLHAYVDMGLSLIKLGEEGRVPLANFSLQGRARKNLRHMLNKARDAGYSFRLVPVEGVPALLPELRAVSDAWLAARKVREKGFSLGFFDEAYLSRFPVAVVEQEGRIVGFANVWPGADRAELSVDLMRHLPGTSGGVMDMLFIELMLWGAAEGYKWFNLGMAPLSGLDDNPLAPLWSRFGAALYQHGENFYNFQGLRRFKEKFDPVWEPRYLASPGGLALPRVLAEVTRLIGKGTRGRRRPRAEALRGAPRATPEFAVP